MCVNYSNATQGVVDASCSYKTWGGDQRLSVTHRFLQGAAWLAQGVACVPRECWTAPGSGCPKMEVEPLGHEGVGGKPSGSLDKITWARISNIESSRAQGNQGHTSKSQTSEQGFPACAGDGGGGGSLGGRALDRPLRPRRTTRRSCNSCLPRRADKYVCRGERMIVQSKPLQASSGTSQMTLLSTNMKWVPRFGRQMCVWLVPG